MNDEAKSLIGRIPDVWFDLYARMIPGLLGVSYCYLLYAPTKWRLSEITFSTGVIVFTGAFVLGCLIQPISSDIAIAIEEKILGRLFDCSWARSDKLVSKSHSELVGAISTAFFSILAVCSILTVCLMDVLIGFKIYSFADILYYARVSLLTVLVLSISIVGVFARSRAYKRKFKNVLGHSGKVIVADN